MATPTVDSTLANYLHGVEQTRSEHTLRAYSNAANLFRMALRHNGLDPCELPIDKLSEESISWLVIYLRDHSPATQRLYLQAMANFYEFAHAERLAEINIARVRLLIHQRTPRQGIRPLQFSMQNIDTVLKFISEPTFTSGLDQQQRLRAMRDRGLILILADTGLRVHEACKLRRGDVDWNEGQAVVIGKGDKQAIVRFSVRSLKALKDYLAARAALDGSSGKPLAALALFSRHDKGAGNKIKSLTTRTGQNIIHERVEQALGKTVSGNITPHSFRHYFVTTVLRASGNLKMAQELARHTSIQVTQRYAHLSNDELDKGYHEIFNESEQKQ